MAHTEPPADALPAARTGRALWIIELLALAAAMALAAALSWRRIDSVDVGYHLAYGRHFLRTGEIVDDNRFVYTEITPANTPDPGPGNWFDADGRYRFPNPSWLSEVVYAAIDRAAGSVGLCVLQLVQVLALFALIALIMLRLGVPKTATAAGLVLVAMTSYERFIHRPEMFGFLAMAGILALLTCRGPGKLLAAGLIGVQWLFVQLHGTWILGIALTGCFFAGAVARAVWARLVAQRPLDAGLRRRVEWLSIALGGQVAAIFANPWTWRLAVLPAQMLLYFRAHGITGSAGGARQHPWQAIMEAMSPFARACRDRYATWAFFVVLALAAVGVIAAVAGVVVNLRRRRATGPRWAWILAIVGMALVGMTIWRNTATAAVVLVPISSVAVAALVRDPRGQAVQAGAFRRIRILRAALAGVVIVLAAWWTACAITGRIYYAQRLPARFGAGWSAKDLPIAAAETLTDLPDGVQTLTTFNDGSNMIYFGGDRGEFLSVPVLTNTWAYPPWVLAENLDFCEGRKPLRPFADRYNIGAAVLDSSRLTGPLMKSLAFDPNWAIARVDGRFVTYIRRIGPTAKLAARRGVLENGFNTDAFIRRIAASDPFPADALNRAAWTLYRLAWGDRRIGGADPNNPDPALLDHEITWARRTVEVWRAAVAADGDYHEATINLAMCLSFLGTAQMQRSQAHLLRNRPDEAARATNRGWAYWRQAREALLDAKAHSPRHRRYDDALAPIDRRMAAFRKGRLLVPKMP